MVDMTADVDFSSCSRAASRMGSIVSGAITQGEFLLRMGAVDRLEQLIELPSTTEEQAERLVASFKHLVDDSKMGKRFKVLAVAHPKVQVEGFPSAEELNLREN